MSKLEIWARGLVAGAIGGAANGISGGITAATIKPEVFNVENGLTDLTMLACGLAVVGAIVGVSAYLKQSPIPPSEAE